MSHDADLAQKRFLEAKRIRHEAEYFREMFEKTHKQMTEMQQSIRELRGDIEGIKRHLNIS